MIKLSQNENAFGVPPLALKAIKEVSSEASYYPDLVHTALENKLAKKFNITKVELIISAGSVSIIDFAMKAFVGLAENIVTAEITYVAYKLFAQINQRECRQAKLVNAGISLDNILALCDDKTKLIFLANPNNPTGSIISHEALENLLKTLKSKVMVVIDESYSEYVSDTTYPNSLELQKKYINLIITRSFSKVYGLAGLRIGYAIAHPGIINSLKQKQIPFTVTNLAAAAALAALNETEFINKSVITNDVERTYLYNELKNLGFNAHPSQGNFIYIEFDTPDKMNKISEYLISKGIYARPLGPFGTDKGLRISVGLPEINKHVIKVLKELYEQ